MIEIPPEQLVKCADCGHGKYAHLDLPKGGELLPACLPMPSKYGADPNYTKKRCTANTKPDSMDDWNCKCKGFKAPA